MTKPKPKAKAPWRECPNKHCGRLKDCQNPAACGTTERPEAIAAWPDDIDIGQPAAVQPEQKPKTREVEDAQKPVPAPGITRRKQAVANAKAPGTKGHPLPAHTPKAIAKAVPASSLDALTDRQAKFVTEYLVDLNATQAAIRAGYSPDTAGAIGYENLRKLAIAEAIDQALMELGGVTRARLVEELAAIALADIREAVTWSEDFHDVEPGDTYFINGQEHMAEDGGVTRVVRQKVRLRDAATLDPRVARAIAEVSQTDKGAIKIKFHDKLGGIDKLARALGMYSEPDGNASSQAGKDVAAVTIYHGRPDRPA